MADVLVRPLKLTVEDVWDYMSDEQFHTIADIAREFEVCAATARSRITMLQEQGYCLVCDQRGWLLIDDTNIDDETIDAYMRSATWIKGTLGRLATISKPMTRRKLISAIRQALPSTQDERRALRSLGVYLQRVIDAADIGDEV